VALESAYAGEDVRSNYRLASLLRNVTLVVGLQGAAGIFLAYDTVPCALIGVVLDIATNVACSAALSTPCNGPCWASSLGPARRPGKVGARPDRPHTTVQPRVSA
jgi:hypothetical protein